MLSALSLCKSLIVVFIVQFPTMGKDNVYICGIISFNVSFVAYAITTGVGWTLDQQVFPDQPAIRAAAIMSTIPVCAVVGYFFLFAACGSDNVNPCAGLIMFSCVFLSGLCAFIGGIIFIAAGAQLDDKHLVAYGVSAGVFGLIAGFSCCCSVGSFCVVLKNQERPLLCYGI